MDESFDLDVAIRDLPLGARQRHPPRPRPRRHRQRHRPRHRPARHPGRALRPRRRRRRLGDDPQRRPAAGRARTPPAPTADGRLNLDATRRLRAPASPPGPSGSVPLGAGDLDLAHRPPGLPAGADRPDRRQPRPARHRHRRRATSPARSPTPRSASTCAARASPPGARRERRAAARRDRGRQLPRPRRRLSAPPASPAPAASTCTAPAASPSPARPRRQRLGHHAARDGQPVFADALRPGQPATLRVNATARGSLAAPQLGGNVTLQRRHARRSPDQHPPRGISLDAGARRQRRDPAQLPRQRRHRRPRSPPRAG